MGGVVVVLKSGTVALNPGPDALKSGMVVCGLLVAAVRPGTVAPRPRTDALRPWTDALRSGTEARRPRTVKDGHT